MKTVPLLVLFCSSAIAQDASLAAVQSACGPVDAQFKIKTDANRHVTEDAPAGEALVYVIEDQKFKAVRDATARVGLDGRWVGANRGDSYLSFEVDPGEHHLCTDWVSSFLHTGRSVSLASLNAEAGKVYFFRARTAGGPSSLLDGKGLQSADAASIDLARVDPDEGKMLVESSPQSVSHPKK